MQRERTRISLSISGEATYKIIGSLAAPVDVIVREISKSGLKFVTPIALKPETSIEITIKITNISEPLQVLAKVLWQRKLTSRFLLDTCVKFIKINDENSNRLVKYIYEYAAASVINREYVRCSLITDIELFDPSGGKIENKCLSADIGVKGMKLFIENILEVGTALVLKFNLPDDNPEFFNLNSKVVWARKRSNTVLGVLFKKLSDRDLNRIVRYVESVLAKKS